MTNFHYGDENCIEILVADGRQRFCVCAFVDAAGVALYQSQRSGV